MAKKRILVPILALILVLLVSVGLFVACDKDPVEYTVTFDYGDGRTTSVTVNEGTALTAEQIPVDVVAPGSNVAFDGWFVGETKVEAGYVVKANVTATAHTTNLYTVTFKNGNDALKTVTVRAGYALTADDFPPFTPEANFEFEGWYVGKTKVEVGYVVNADATVNPVTTQLFTVTFKNGEEVVKTLTVKSGAQLSAEQIPDDLQAELGFRFDGWYVEETKIEAGYAVSADIIAQPKFVDAMAGTYTDGMYTIVLDGAGNITLVDYRQEEFAGTYTIVDGGVVADFENDGLDTTYTIIEDGKVITEEYYGDVVEYVKEGAQFDSHVQDFVGVWKYMDTTYGDPVETFIDISLDGESIVILVNGENMPYTAANYNGTKVSWYYGSNVLAFDNGVLKLNGEFECTKVDTTTFKFTVSFELEDGTVVASQQVAYGQALNADELPSDSDVVAPFGFAFDGWYNENNDILDEEALVYANATYVAQFVQEKIIVKFMNGDQEVAKAAVDFGGKLIASDIPSAVSGVGVFIGYYDSKNVKAEAGVTPSGTYDENNVYTATYYATFVNESDYTGSWINTTEGEMVVFGDNNSVSTMGVNGAWEFDATTGQAVYKVSSVNKYNMLVVGDTLVLGHYYYDSMEEDFVEPKVVLTKATSEVSGTFYKNKNTTLVVNNGLGTQCGGSAYFVYVDGENIYYKNYASSKVVKVAVDEIDENGNIIVSSSVNNTVKGVWVKVNQGSKDYYNSDKGYLYVFTVNGNQFVVYKDKSENYFKATTDVEIAEGAIVTVTYNETETLVVKISGTSFTTIGAEAGTYTGANGNLVLDGFGTATIDGTTAEYYIVSGTAVVGADGFSLNAEDNTYTVVVADELKGKLFNRQYGWAATFDGYGRVFETYNGEVKGFGEYSLDKDAGKLTISGSFSNIKATTYTVEQNGEVLAPASGTPLVLDGCEIVMYTDQFIGDWADTEGNQVKINNDNVTYKGTAYKATWNWNGSVVTFEAKDSRHFYDITLTHTCTIAEGKLVIEHTYYTGYDDVYEELTGETTVTETFDPAQAEPDAFAGVWEGKNSYNLNVKLTFDGLGKVVVEYDTDVAKEVEYTVNNGKASLSYNYCDWTMTIVEGSLNVTCEDEYNPWTATLTKKVEQEEQLDAFAGIWVNGDMSWTFDGKGSVVVAGANAGTYTYTVDATGKVATYYNSAYSETITCTLQEDGTMLVHDQYSEWLNNIIFTKQA